MEVIRDLDMRDTKGELIRATEQELQMDQPYQVVALTNADHTLLKKI